MRFVIVVMAIVLGVITLSGQLYVVDTAIPVLPVTDEVQALYKSTVWIGVQGPLKPTFLMTGWSVLNKDGRCYIVTAAHGVAYNTTDLVVAYWVDGGKWTIAPARFEGAFYGHKQGDVAILSIPVIVTPLPMKGPSYFSLGDEILVGGIQHDVIGRRVTPARVTVGQVVRKSIWDHSFIIDGWAWSGFSGGPVLHRKTKSVVGFISHSPTGHEHDAALTVCIDASRVRALILKLGL